MAKHRKLSSEEKKRIFEDDANGMSQQEIANKYGIKQPSVSNILNPKKKNVVGEKFDLTNPKYTRPFYDIMRGLTSPKKLMQHNKNLNKQSCAELLRVLLSENIISKQGKSSRVEYSINYDGILEYITKNLGRFYDPNDKVRQYFGIDIRLYVSIKFLLIDYLTNYIPQLNRETYIKESVDFTRKVSLHKIFNDFLLGAYFSRNKITHDYNSLNEYNKKICKKYGIIGKEAERLLKDKKKITIAFCSLAKRQLDFGGSFVIDNLTMPLINFWFKYFNDETYYKFITDLELSYTLKLYDKDKEGDYIRSNKNMEDVWRRIKDDEKIIIEKLSKHDHKGILTNYERISADLN